jgi:hypothetical protein
MAVSILMTRPGFSLKLSYVRPQRRSLATQTHGANTHWGPVARVSMAVTCSICSTSRGLRVAPRPMLCGNTTAPLTPFMPWTASTP